jgi:hypothetical protein
MGPLNWLGIVVATLAFFAVGAIWYSVLFGKLWRREVGLGAEQLSGGRNMTAIFALCLLLEFVVVLMLGHMFARLQPSDHVKMMMATGFALAIMSPAIGINYLYQRRSLTLFLIDAGHFVVGMAVVGLVFVLLG